jgi:hypothetical protein
VDYARAIVEHFVVLRGKGSAVSSADEGLLLGWERDGFPLEIVLDGIDQAFDRKTDPPKSLTECGRWVRSQFKKWSGGIDESLVPDTSNPTRTPPLSDEAPLPGLPSQDEARLVAWKTSDLRPLREAAVEMWADLVSQVAVDGVISGEVVAILEDAVRLLALDKGADEEELGEHMG